MSINAFLIRSAVSTSLPRRPDPMSDQSIAPDSLARLCLVFGMVVLKSGRLSTEPARFTRARALQVMLAGRVARLTGPFGLAITGIPVVLPVPTGAHDDSIASMCFARPDDV